MISTATAVFAFVLPVIVMIMAGKRFADMRRGSSRSAEWTGEMSVERYRPMYRLLEDQNVEFLRSQPGATAGMVERLRTQRVELFRGYLRSLKRDFQHASDGLVVVMMHSEVDRKDLVRALLKARVKFALGMLRVRWELGLHRRHFGRQRLAVLVNLLDGLQGRI